jgi:uracil-DNA glycosylase
MPSSRRGENRNETLLKHFPFEVPVRRAPAKEVREAAPAYARESLKTLRETATDCRACPLWRHATQTVFGEGAKSAPLFIVGEQPGHYEDLEGHPFVGPAGQLFERAYELAGVPRDMMYLTNAVKHFKWELRGKRRMHKTPVQTEISACLPWLEAELELVNPQLVLALGATAARAVIGATVRLGEHRGHLLQTPSGIPVMVSIHPAYVLRLRGGEAEAAYKNLVEDLAAAAQYVKKHVRESKNN